MLRSVHGVLTHCYFRAITTGLAHRNVELRYEIMTTGMKRASATFYSNDMSLKTLSREA